MLIINRNLTLKYVAINSDYVYEIFISQESQEDYRRFSVCLGIRSGSNVTYFDIVTYKTEERAEKELDNILEAYANNERVYFIKEENK